MLSIFLLFLSISLSFFSISLTFFSSSFLFLLLSILFQSSPVAYFTVRLFKIFSIIFALYNIKTLKKPLKSSINNSS